MKLAIYIIRRYLMSLVRVQIGITILIFLLNATEQLRFLSNKDATIKESIWLILTSIPEVMWTTFPLVCLLASLFTFLGLSRSSEMVVIRATGVPALKVIIAPLVTTLVLGIFIVTLLDPILAATKRRYEDIRGSFSGRSSQQLSVSDDGLWLRQANENLQFVIHARSSTGDGRILSDVHFHEFTWDGILTRRIMADHAELLNGEWRLTNAVQWRKLEKNLDQVSDVSVFPVLFIPTELTSDEILNSFISPQEISVWRISDFIQQLERSGFTAIRHRLHLQSRIASPLFLVAMALVGAVFALQPARFSHTGVMSLLAVLSGFLLFTIKNIAESLGQAQEVSIPLAVWTPSIAAMLLTIGLILHMEDG